VVVGAATLGLSALAVSAMTLWQRFNSTKRRRAASDRPRNPPPVQGGKKGVGLARGKPGNKVAREGEFTRHRGGWEQRVAALRPSWFYTWGPRLPDTAPEGVEFVPMVFSGGGDVEKVRDRMKHIKELHEAGKIRAVLGFNEPDGKAQANMTVKRAVELWPELHAEGLALGSPAAIKATRPWMREFMAECEKRDHRVDFVTVHWYAGLNVDALVRHLHEVHDLYGRPIWITEFGVADYQAKDCHSGRFRPEQVQAFMRKVLPALDALEFVHRYAWFCFDETSRVGSCSALFHATIR
jgi:hypothetical protein